MLNDAKHRNNAAEMFDLPLGERFTALPHIGNASADRKGNLEVIPDEEHGLAVDLTLGGLLEKNRQSHTPSTPLCSTRQQSIKASDKRLIQIISEVNFCPNLGRDPLNPVFASKWNELLRTRAGSQTHCPTASPPPLSPAEEP